MLTFNISNLTCEKHMITCNLFFCRHVTYVACLHIYLVFSVDKLLVDTNMSNVDKIIASRYKN